MNIVELSNWSDYDYKMCELQLRIGNRFMNPRLAIEQLSNDCLTEF